MYRIWVTELTASLRQPLQGFIFPLLETSTSFPNWKSMRDKHRLWILLHPFLHWSKKPLNIWYCCVFSPEVWTSYSYHLSSVPALEQSTHNRHTAALKRTGVSSVSAWAVWLFSVSLLGDPHSRACPYEQVAAFISSHLSQRRGAACHWPHPNSSFAHMSTKARLASVVLACISLNLLLRFRLQKACNTIVKTFSSVSLLKIRLRSSRSLEMVACTGEKGRKETKLRSQPKYLGSELSPNNSKPCFQSAA